MAELWKIAKFLLVGALTVAIYFAIALELASEICTG
jgi:hypothetical protein